VKHTVWTALAFCTAVSILITVPSIISGKISDAENLSGYQREQISLGAPTFPVLAQQAYRAALKDLRAGRPAEAEKQLKRAQELDPNFPDVYFTLARIKLTQFSSDVLFYLVKAFSLIAGQFRYQSLLLINTVIVIILLLIMLSGIFCIAFMIKYLPFAAHQLKEILKTNFKAAFPALAAYVILLMPFVLLPSFITAFALVIPIAWLFMYRRERFLLVMFVMPFVILAVFSNKLKPLTPLADPKSFTSLVARANTSPGTEGLIRSIAGSPAESFEEEKHLTLGLLYLRSENFEAAAEHLFRAISINPNKSTGYINLGNVYFLQSSYQKALEGYRKGEGIDPDDPICQYDLAQAYIKTLLLTESSVALRKSSALGIEKVKTSYSPTAIKDMHVFPMRFSNRELWGITMREGKEYSRDYLSDLILPLTLFPHSISAWILIGSLFVALVLSKLVDPRKRTFQCSNCGSHACHKCSTNEREMYLCRECAKSIEGVTSDKVIDALLRQKRQTVVVRRRRSFRFLTMMFPGVRDIYYGRISRGLLLAGLFSLSIIQLFARGYIIKDSASLTYGPSMWKTILPVSGIVIAYVTSMLSKSRYEFRDFLKITSRLRVREPKSGPVRDTRTASG
jgi:tetratricopeptide (TPR) repeat protein